MVKNKLMKDENELWCYYSLLIFAYFIISQSPGQYFLRPMMKEYKFEPASRMIDVTEGTAVDVNIVGVRTAYR